MARRPDTRVDRSRSTGLLTGPAPPAATSAQSPTPSSRLNAHRKALAVLVMIAAAAALARHSDGASLLPAWAGPLLQVPASFAWLGWRCGWFRGRGSGRDRVVTICLLLAAGLVAALRGSPETFFVAVSLFMAGSLGIDVLAGVYRGLEQEAVSARGALRVLLRPWLTLVLIATIMLGLPPATKSSVPDYRHNFWRHVLSGAFSATSAACLVGTTPYSPGEDFTVLGQAVLFLTAQLSAMGFAALGLAASRPLLRRPLSLRTTLCALVLIELLGAAIMAPAWSPRDADGAASRLWQGLVYANGSLLNAGLRLRPDGLADYLDTPAIFIVSTALAIAGSLGLPVIADLLRPAERRRTGAPWKNLPQWEAGAAFCLLLVAAVLLFLFETPGFLPASCVPERPVDLGAGFVGMREDISYASRWRLAVFTAAQFRSAGIQSVPVSEGAISVPTYLLALLCMCTGGSACGVAGGFRMTALLLFAIALLHPRREWESHPGGAAARRLLLTALPGFAALWFVFNLAAVALLTAATDASTYELVFDGVAAAGSVGFSTGASLHLSIAGQMVFIAAMVIGRWAPVVFWLALGQRLAALTSGAGRDSMTA